MRWASRVGKGLCTMRATATLLYAPSRLCHPLRAAGGVVWGRSLMVCSMKGPVSCGVVGVPAGPPDP